METKVHKELTAVTNEGYGEVMTVRHMDMPPTQHSNCFMVGVVTHHYDWMSSNYEVDPYDFEVIKTGTRELT